jgi:hypothetical protein
MMGDTPRTDALMSDMSEGWPDRWAKSHAQLERELAEAKEQLHLCNVDQLTTAAELAEAVAKERERCVKIVEQYTGAWDDEGFALAAAIRKGE